VKGRWFAPRGLLINTTLDVASTAFGSQIQLIPRHRPDSPIFYRRSEISTPGVVEDQTGPPLLRWFQQSSLAFGARAGLVHSLNHSGPDEPTTLPIDERFFNGGATTVRSFGERKLGPEDPKEIPSAANSLPSSMSSTRFRFTASYRAHFSLMPGDLLPTSEEPGVDDMRYALGGGLRYKLRSVQSGSIMNGIRTAHRPKTWRVHFERIRVLMKIDNL